MNRLNKEKGFIETIILIIVGLALLKYFFDWSIFEFLSSAQGREVFQYVKDIFTWIKEAIVSLINYIR